MEPENNIEKRIADTLNSLEGLGKAEVKPFFYSRLEARMQNELLPSANRFAFIGGLRLNVALLSLFMVFNIFTFFALSQETEVETESRDGQIESLAKDYFSGSDDYDYLNDY